MVGRESRKEPAAFDQYEEYYGRDAVMGKKEQALLTIGVLLHRHSRTTTGFGQNLSSNTRSTHYGVTLGELPDYSEL